MEFIIVAAVVSALIASTAFVLAWTRHVPSPDLRDSVFSHTVIGHRGCRFVSGITENSIESCEYAVAQSADGFEVDINLTTDNELVVFHDSSFHGKPVQSLTYVDMCTASFTPPTAPQIVHLARSKGCLLLIEIKSVRKIKEIAKRLVTLFHEAPEYMMANAMVISFHPYSLACVRWLDPRIATCLLTLPCCGWYVMMRWWLRPSAVGYHKFAVRSSDAEHHAANGMMTYIWGMENPADVAPDVLCRRSTFITVDDDFKSYR